MAHVQDNPAQQLEKAKAKIKELETQVLGLKNRLVEFEDTKLNLEREFGRNEALEQALTDLRRLFSDTMVAIAKEVADR
jgi:hypothetical protein